MVDFLKETLWKQFGASIDMLKNAISSCPEDYWDKNRKYFYISYHCLIFLDYYLTIPAGKMSSPLPFTIAKPADIPADAVDDIIPDEIYSKKELLEYLEASREKCRKVIAGLTEGGLQDKWVEVPEEGGRTFSIFKLLLYNMRHVQHHAAQLNLLLRQGTNNAPNWVSETKDSLY